MKESILRRYIKLVIEDQNARVPTQLIDPDSEEHGCECEGECECVDEFASVAGAMGGGSGFGGYMAPLGSSKKKKKQNVSEIIRRCGSKWCLYSRKTGKKLGTHDSKGDAKRQERAIFANK